ADRLDLAGKSEEADQVRLQARITYLEKIKEIQTALNEDTRLTNAQIATAQAQLYKVGTLTLNLGSHIANTLSTMFNALISGTLRAVDIGKAAIGFIGNVVTD